ncbi:MAG: DNA circularization N-terminal domain-containing protein [Alphaproteobacteria bacterium]|nr:DNA circularization N-terminal domain-containing protein [Alphaproteobacteria bacterium]
MKEYRKASYKGIEFEVDSRSFTGGRRLQVHEYPNKDVPYTEDLGKKADNYAVTAFVLGSDYESKRDSLKKACLDGEAGTLIHPDYGSIEVKCDSITVKETKDQGGMAVFELVFIEAGEKAIPETSIDLSESVLGASGNMLSSAKDNFSKAFKIASGVAEITALVGGIATSATSALNSIGSGLDYAEGLTGSVTSAMNKVVDAASLALSLKTNAKSLLNTPSALAAQMDAVFSVVTSLAGKKPEAFKTVRNLASGTNASESVSTSNTDAVAEKQSMQQLEQLTKQIVIAKEAEIITEIEFENADEATSILESFVSDTEEVELFEDIEPSNEVMQSLREVREAVVQYVREIILELPRTKTVTLSEKTPSLVLAYDLYEDLSRADEICKKNKIPYPAFVPADKDLRVLTE